MEDVACRGGSYTGCKFEFPTDNKPVRQIAAGDLVALLGRAERERGQGAAGPAAIRPGALISKIQLTFIDI